MEGLTCKADVGWEEVEKTGKARLGKIIRDAGWVAGSGYKLNSLEAQVRADACTSTLRLLPFLLVLSKNRALHSGR